MSNTAHELTERLLNALDKNYNVVDMVAVNDVISVLENIKITKELLETTRLGKHVNELRRQSTDPTLARRAKLLVKKWRDLILPAGGKSQSSSSSQHTPTGSVDNTPYQSPLGSRGYSPVAPMLTSPQVFPQTQNSSHKHGSLTPSSINFKTSALPQQIHQNVRHRQPLTSPGHRNVPQIAKNPSVPFSPGLSKLASPLVSPVVSGHSRNASPALKNLSPGIPQKISSNVNKNISPGSNLNRNVIPGVNSNRHSPSILSRNSSPGIVNSNKINSPGVSSFKNISPTDRSLLIGQSANKMVNTAVKNLSPALRLPPESLAVKTSSNKKSEHYDSDSQDVIWVDDDEDIHKPVPVNPLTVNDRSNDGSRHSSGKRPRSPVNGEQWKDDSEHSHRAAKKAKKETRGRKPKKRRNHKSENRTVDHSLDPVPSPLPPAINSSSTSPVLKNGLASLGSAPIHPPAFSIPVLVDDIDSRSPKPEATVVKQRSSRKNGCKKNSLAMDDYSAFIKNKIPAAGKKVKTTQELLEDIQSRKLGSASVELEEKCWKPKEDFLTAYDNKKKETSVVADVIELNDSNSSLKQEESSSSKKVDVKIETKDNDKENEPVKFEPVETILARLPPIDRSWMYTDEVVLTPPCTCTLIYTTPDTEVKLPNTSPLHQPKKSIFEMDYEDTPSKDTAVKEESIGSVVVPALPAYEEKIDPYCEAAVVHERIPSDIADPQVLALHNCLIPDVNGSTCDKKLQFGSKKKPICKMDYWGSKPYYDCSNQLFHNVVPKYNYLDYSLDRCVKNLTKVRLDKYEPADVTIGTKDWLNDLERKSAEEIAIKLDKTEEFNSPADSPFSEGVDESSCLSTKIQVSDRVNSNEYTDSVNLDRDLAISNSVAFDENSCSQSATTKYTNHLLYGESSADREYQMDCEDADSVGSESCKPWTEKQTQQQMKTDQNLDINAQDQIVSNSDVSCGVKTNNKTSLNYGDSALLLPLNLKALSAAVAAGGSSSSKISSDCDLSCVFRTNYHKSFLDDTLSYSAIVEPVRLQQFSDLKREGVYERLKRNGSIDQSAMIEQDEDAVSDVEIKPKITDNILNNNIDNSGALIPDLDVCVSSGCPEWLEKLSRDEGFREWHEPVVRTSFNDEPLTILPYIVID